jgi:hypothetical protein
MKMKHLHPYLAQGILALLYLHHLGIPVKFTFGLG